MPTEVVSAEPSGKEIAPLPVLPSSQVARTGRIASASPGHPLLISAALEAIVGKQHFT